MAGKLGELTKKFGLKVKFERIKRKLSQEQFANMANLSTSALWAIENGNSAPSIETANDIANALGIELKDLIDVNNISL